MEPQRAASSSKLCPFLGSPSREISDIMDIASSSSCSSASNQKRKRNQPDQVVPHDVVESKEASDADAIMIIDESTSDYKNKQSVGYDDDMRSEIEDAFPEDDVGSSTKHVLGEDIPLDSLISSDPMLDFNYSDDYDYGEDENVEDEYEEDDGDYYEDGLAEIDTNVSLAAKFDDLDLPPGVELPVPWLQKPTPETPGNIALKAIVEDVIDMKFSLFKQFDVVEDYSDHYFNDPKNIGPVGKKPTKDWGKRIQHEWKVLGKDLPETIYVRVYEDKMELLRAVIIGPDGTPYHDGLFFFDVYFPVGYPNEPPKVHYHSGGLRLNPNLYACGKVCLSLLNTWSGETCERWCPSKSTMLQVLVSIQALVLNAKPYFNEPGYASSANTPHGEKLSRAYNEDTFVFSCKTMLYSLRRPPKHFEDFIAGHFRKQGRKILLACKSYVEGAPVAGLHADHVPDEIESRRTVKFKESLSKLFEDLLMEFTVKGAECKKFLDQKVKDGAAKAMAAMLAH